MCLLNVSMQEKHLCRWSDVKDTNTCMHFSNTRRAVNTTLLVVRKQLLTHTEQHCHTFGVKQNQYWLSGGKCVWRLERLPCMLPARLWLLCCLELPPVEMMDSKELNQVELLVWLILQAQMAWLHRSRISAAFDTKSCFIISLYHAKNAREPS